MTDNWSKQKRSEVMGRIRSHGNKATELRLIALLRAARITGWRRRQKLAGRPDFVFRRAGICIFVDGCFWHGCPACYRGPKSNQEYWIAKVQRNRRRDALVTRRLRREGWRVMRIREHELKNDTRVTGRLTRAFW